MVFFFVCLQNKTLLSCYQKRQEEERAFTTRQADRVYLINFPDFNDSTVKNKVNTPEIKEVLNTTLGSDLFSSSNHIFQGD